MQYGSILTSIALTGALFTLTFAACAQARQDGASDEILLEMNQAYKQGNSKRLSDLLPRIKQHRLLPWAAYWELSTRLNSASPEEILNFLSRYKGSYHEDRLRNDWLLMLGQRRDWRRFADQAPNFRMNDDREVRCYTLAMDQIVSGISHPEEVKHQWYSQKDPGEGCALAAASHFAAKQLTEADIWRKARLAMDARQIKATRLAVHIAAPEADGALKNIQANPDHFLTKQSFSERTLNRELVVLAFIQLAATDLDKAITLLQQRWGAHLSKGQRNWCWGIIGKQAAQKRLPNALHYFANASSRSDLGDEHLAWWARAALRLGQWHEVLTAIQAMNTESSSDPTWVYWRARAQKQIAKTDEERSQATQWLKSIAGVYGFYEMLALEELGQRITLPVKPEPLTASEKEAARTNTGLQQALAAIQSGLRQEGVRQWNYHTNLHQTGGMNDRELLAAADLACQNEVWDRCINTSDRTKNIFDLTQRYPMPHQQAVVTRCRQIGIDPAYVYGLIRQESRFVTDARSSVGASGLMQVMPATARWTAKKYGLADFQAHQITDLDTNIAIGTGYLKLVLDSFAGSMPMAAAAYNAGPSRPRQWQGGSLTLDAAIWAENVPFAETRDYVKKVLVNTTLYAAVMTGQPQSLKSRLGLIGPRKNNKSITDLP